MRFPTMRFPKHAALRTILIAFFCGLCQGLNLRADEPPGPPSGEVRLGNGRIVDYTIHFDRNSLRNSQRLANSLIALTSSGTLLRFDQPTVRLGRERIGAEEVTCLGRGQGEVVLAGLSDGRVCRVDPTTLDLTDVAKLLVPSAVDRLGKGQGEPTGGPGRRDPANQAR